MTTKAQLRKQALKIRQNLHSSSMDDLIVHKILNSVEFIRAKHVGLYSPIKNEVDITKIINIDNKNFYFPCCIENELVFKRYDKKSGFINGCYDIKEPCEEVIDPNILDIIYIPALMANSLCYRLGYGKGYYDRFFKKNNIGAKKILVLQHDLISNEFVQDDFDIALDAIICEK